MSFQYYRKQVVSAVEITATTVHTHTHTHSIPVAQSQFDVNSVHVNYASYKAKKIHDTAFVQ